MAKLRRPAFIAVAYALVSWVWVFSTDPLMSHWSAHPLATIAGTFKDATYLGATGFFIYVLLHRLYLQLAHSQRLEAELAAANTDLQQKVALGIAELRKGEERYRRIVETADEGICELNEQNLIAFVNSKFADMLGYTEGEIIGTSPLKYCDPEWRAKAESKLEEFLSGTRGLFELRMRRKDGNDVWAIISANGIVEDGSYRGATVLVTDITRRKQSEEQLQEYATELTSLIENAPYGIARTTADGKFLLVNPALVQMTGFGSTRELLGTPVLTLYRNPADRDRILKNVSAETTVRNIELEWAKKDGTPIKVRMSGALLPTGELQMIVEDITHARLLEDQLRQAVKMEAVGRLAGGIAHDFNNLLMVITSNLELMLEGKGGPERIRKRVLDAMHASERAAKLTSHLLAFSRKQVLQPSRVNLNETIQQVTRLIERVIGEDIFVRLECSPTLGAVEVDLAQIEQVIMNLAVNARDAMPNGGTLVIETANVVLDEPYLEQHPFVPAGKYVMLAVSDTGIGMDAATQARIFEPFFTTKELGKGTGLGLSTSYGVVKQSGGHIAVYSEPGQGTTFKVYLPRVDAKPKNEAERPTAVTNHAGHGSILVVEDEELIREALTQQLNGCGYDVLHAATAKEALHAAELHRNRLVAVLTDVVLPDSNGKALGEAISQVAPGVPIIHMSGYTPNVVVHHGVLDTGTFFLQKPFSKNQLLQLLSNVLATTDRP
jgi:two-component system, cell cycle sensor histidine kinase and response regulator CckA